jgi:hypothetical protein
VQKIPPLVAAQELGLWIEIAQFLEEEGEEDHRSADMAVHTYDGNRCFGNSGVL